eukprot:scaffold410_cov153-Skeletonema_dohrnii-CCMP3373.AAC.3
MLPTDRFLPQKPRPSPCVNREGSSGNHTQLRQTKGDARSMYQESYFLVVYRHVRHVGQTDSI